MFFDFLINDPVGMICLLFAVIIGVNALYGYIAWRIARHQMRERWRLEDEKRGD